MHQAEIAKQHFQEATPTSSTRQSQKKSHASSAIQRSERLQEELPTIITRQSLNKKTSN